MKHIEQNQVCIEKECRFNRIITNWHDLQLHYHNQHKVQSQDTFEKKVNLKLNQLNEKFRMQIQDSISDYIEIQEQQIQQKIKSLFQNIQKIYFQLLQDQFKMNEQQQRLFSNNSFESNLNNYIDIYYCQFRLPQQKQLENLEEIKYQLNGITYELMNFLDEQEYNHQLKIKQYSNNMKNKQEDLNIQKQIQYQQNQNQVELNQYEYKYPQQQLNFDTHPIQLQDQGNQNIKKQQQFSYQYSRDQLQEQSKEQIKKPQQQQIIQYPKTLINDDQDRIQFQLPSDNTKINSNFNKSIQVQGIQENIQQQNKQVKEDIQLMKQQNDQVQNDRIYQETNIIGKKFDITNSDKHLKYSLRFTQFSCDKEGVALVEGAFKLNDNAKVKFKFSERLEKVLTASFGMINVDQQGYKIGTLNYWMDQSGLLYKNEKSTQGSLKIDLNQEFTLEYNAQKRLLSFRKQNTIEQIHFEESINGSFKFYVKLYGLQVQIIK
ncbi:unnamed protein product [Paramecium pentaurelia]|uniref:Uncharacterized protein n=1 Tax=Paramecium pentaurelia TaxID=43138 RepID=A0A8S1TJY6_9CILI|nr:unnamed protein product [Paramecium pentaurelia]